MRELFILRSGINPRLEMAYEERFSQTQICPIRISSQNPRVYSSRRRSTPLKVLKHRGLRPTEVFPDPDMQSSDGAADVCGRTRRALEFIYDISS